MECPGLCGGSNVTLARRRLYSDDTVAIKVSGVLHDHAVCFVNAPTCSLCYVVLCWAGFCIPEA